MTAYIDLSNLILLPPIGLDSSPPLFLSLPFNSKGGWGWLQYSHGSHFTLVLVEHHHHSLLFHILGLSISAGSLNIHAGFSAKQSFLSLLFFYYLFGSIYVSVGLPLRHFVFFLRDSTSDWRAMIFASLSHGALCLLVVFISLNLYTSWRISLFRKISIPSSYYSLLLLTYLINNLFLYVAYPLNIFISRSFVVSFLALEDSSITLMFLLNFRFHVHILPWTLQGCSTGSWFGKLLRLYPSGNPWLPLLVGCFLICEVWWSTPLTICSACFFAFTYSVFMIYLYIMWQSFSSLVGLLMKVFSKALILLILIFL